MTGEKRKFLVRGVLNSDSGATKFSKVVKAHSGQEAEEYVRRNIQESAIIYSVNPMIDVEYQEAPVADKKPAIATVAGGPAANNNVLPWFGGWKGLN